jgi:hypothetical protein
MGTRHTAHGNVRASTLLKLLERVEAEEAVLDAMAMCPEAALRSYPDIAVCVAELARRGLK